MSDKANLTNAELELTQKIQRQFPRGLYPEAIQAWNGCRGEVMEQALQALFSQAPDRRDGDILHCISTGESLVIAPKTGQRTIAQAGNVFTAGIDSDFKNWSLDVPGKATPETPISVYQMVANANFAQMFGSLSSDLNTLCFEQDQIVGFCEEHRGWLRGDGFGTFFLFKENGHFFVAGVDVRSGGALLVDVSPLEVENVWGAVYRYQVVVPQLAVAA